MLLIILRLLYVLSGLLMSKKVAFLFALLILVASSLSVLVPINARLIDNSWKTMAPMPTARIDPGLAVLNGKIYAIGGYNGFSTLNINEMYDPATNTWVTKKPSPTTQAVVTAVLNNKIYYMGGSIDGVNQVYDQATDSWEIKHPMPTPRSALSASVVNGKIYLIGGLVLGSIIPSEQEPSKVNEMYDPATDSWTNMAPLPIAVAYCISAVVDYKIYVFGNGDRTLIYDTRTDMWSYGLAMPYSVSYGAAAATTGVYAPKRIYRIGGIVSTSTQIFDPQTQTWTTGAEMPTSRRFLSVAVMDDVLYAIGGQENSGNGLTISDANERYKPLEYTSVPPKVQVVSPEQNKTYASGNVSLAFTVDRHFTELCYSMNDEANVTITGNTTLTGLSEGLHNVTVYAADLIGNMGESQAAQFTVDFPPNVLLLSPQNQTYTSTSVLLNFTVNKPVSYISYVLDGLENVTVNGNTTLTALASGDHNVTVYAADETGNVGASETISFSLDTPFPTALAVAATVTAITSVIVVAVVAVIYAWKKKQS
jgi:hypothetical protein